LRVPSIQIHQQYAKIGINADLGRYEMRQPRADVRIETTPAAFSIESPRGELRIDQSKAWDALAIGSNLQTMSRIYAQGRQAAMEGIGRRVDEGRQFAAIHHGGNAIAEVAAGTAYRRHPLQVAGEASFDNVDLSYTAHKPNISVREGDVHIQVTPNRPEVSYYRGKLDIYMMQYGQVTITPPQIDLQM